MVIILQILMLFIVIKTLLKLSFWKMWKIILFAAVSTIFVIVAEQFAILQSKTQIADYLSNREYLQDAAVLISLESVLAISFCFTAFKIFLGKQSKKWHALLIYFPGVLIFPVLFFVLTQSVFSFPGTNFKTVTYIVALITFLIISLGSLGFKYFLPEREFRLEVHFLVSLFVMGIGLLTTVNGQVTYAYDTSGQNKTAVFVALCLFVFAFLAGLLLNRLKWHRFNKKRIER